MQLSNCLEHKFISRCYSCLVLKFTACFIILETCQELFLFSSVEQLLSKTLLLTPDPASNAPCSTSLCWGPKPQMATVPPDHCTGQPLCMCCVSTDWSWTWKQSGTWILMAVLRIMKSFIVQEKKGTIILQCSFVNGVSGTGDTL